MLSKNWEMLELAQKNLKRCEAMDNVSIDMAEWLRINKDGTCVVCMAGSMIIDLAKKPGSYTPIDFPELDDRLLHIDNLRKLYLGKYDGSDGEFHRKLQALIDKEKLADH